MYLDVQVVGGQDELEQGALVHLEEVRIPGADVVCPLLLVLVILGQRRVVLVVGGPLDHLLQDGGVHVGEGDHLLVLLVHAEVLQHGLDGDGLLGDLHIHGEHLPVRGLQLDRWHYGRVKSEIHKNILLS